MRRFASWLAVAVCLVGSTVAQSNLCDVGSVSAEEACDYIAANPEACDISTLIPYSTFHFCTVPVHYRALSVILLVVLLLYFFFLTGSVAEDYFSATNAVICEVLNLPHNLAGVTFLAFGNAAADIFSSFAGLTSGHEELGLGAILGAGVFVPIMVLGATCWVAPNARITRRPFLRDCLFLGVAVGAILYLVKTQRIYLGEAVGMLSMYFVYVTVVVVGRLIYVRNKRRKERRDQRNSKHRGNYNELPHSEHDDPYYYSDSDSEDDLFGDDNGPFLSLRSLPKRLKPRPLVDLRSNGAVLGDSAFPVKSAGVSYRSRSTTSSSTSPRNGSSHHPSVFSSESFHVSTRSAKPSRSGSLDSILDDNPPNLDHHANGVSSRKPSRHFYQNGGDSHKNGHHVPNDASLQESMLSSEAAYEISMSPLFIHSPDTGGPNAPPGTFSNSSPKLLADKSRSDTMASDGDDNDDDSESQDPSLLAVFSPPPKPRSRIALFTWTVGLPFSIMWRLTIPIVSKGRWSRNLAVFQCFGTPLFIMVALQELLFTYKGVPIAAVVFAVGACLAIATWVRSSPNPETPVFLLWFLTLSFVCGCVWIYTISNELVGLLATLGFVSGVSQAILGLTVLAWGNSVPDLIANVAVAKMGYPGMAVGAAFGSSLLTHLFSFGLAMTYNTISQSPSLVPRNGTLFLCLIFELIGVVSNIIILPLNKFRLPKRYALYCLTVYVIFIVLNVLVVRDVIHFS